MKSAIDAGLYLRGLSWQSFESHVCLHAVWLSDSSIYYWRVSRRTCRLMAHILLFVKPVSIPWYLFFGHAAPRSLIGTDIFMWSIGFWNMIFPLGRFRSGYHWERPKVRFLGPRYWCPFPFLRWYGFHGSIVSWWKVVMRICVLLAVQWLKVPRR